MTLCLSLNVKFCRNRFTQPFCRPSCLPSKWWK